MNMTDAVSIPYKKPVRQISVWTTPFSFLMSLELHLCIVCCVHPIILKK